MDSQFTSLITKSLRIVRPWYFLVAFFIFGAIFIYAYRNNYEHMTVLRAAVYQADQNNGDVNTALKKLQAYVTTNMNTYLVTSKDSPYPPIQLEYTYERLQQTELAQQLSSNDQLYTAAQGYCQQQDSTDFSGRNRVPCIEQYVESHGTQVNLDTIPAGLYEFSFATPEWAPDLAGWTLVASVASLALFPVSLLTKRYFQRSNQ